MIRRILLFLNLLFFMTFPVSAHTVYNGTKALPAMTVQCGKAEAETVIQNDTAYAQCIYVSAETGADTAIQLQVFEGGQWITVYTGKADALVSGKYLLCTLQPQHSVEIRLESTEKSEEAIRLELTAEPLQNGVPDPVRLAAYVGIWMVLVILGSGIVVLISNRKQR